MSMLPRLFLAVVLLALPAASQAVVITAPGMFSPVPIGLPLQRYEMFDPSNWPNGTPNFLPWCPLEDLDAYYGSGFGPGNKIAIVSGLCDTLYFVLGWHSSALPPAWKGASLSVDAATSPVSKVYLAIFPTGAAVYQPPIITPAGLNYGAPAIMEIKTGIGSWTLTPTSPGTTWPATDVMCPIVYTQPAGSLAPLVGLCVEVQVVWNVQDLFGFGTLAAFAAVTEII